MGDIHIIVLKVYNHYPNGIPGLIYGLCTAFLALGYIEIYRLQPNVLRVSCRGRV